MMNHRLLFNEEIEIQFEVSRHLVSSDFPSNCGELVIFTEIIFKSYKHLCCFM